MGRVFKCIHDMSLGSKQLVISRKRCDKNVPNQLSNPVAMVWMFCEGMHAMNGSRSIARPSNLLEGDAHSHGEAWCRLNNIPRSGKDWTGRKGCVCSNSFLRFILGTWSFPGWLVWLEKKKLQELERARETNQISIPLLGQLNGEDGSQYHLTPLATCTDSGLVMKKWVSRLPEARELEGRAHGLVSCNKQGQVVWAKTYEMMILDWLLHKQITKPELITMEINVYEE